MTLRLSVLVAIIVVASTVTGVVGALQLLPTHGKPTISPTEFSVRVVAFYWYPGGCGFANHTSSGGTFRAGGDFNLTLVVNDRQTDNCTVSAPRVAPTSFGLAASDLPLAVLSGGSATIRLTLQAPQFAAPANVTIELTSTLEK